MENKEWKEDGTVLFRIAGHLVKVTILPRKNWKKVLPSFAPFRCIQQPEGEEPLLTVKAVNSLEYLDLSSSKLLIESTEIVGACFRLMETETQYMVDIQFVRGGVWHRMLCDKSFGEVKVRIRWSDPHAGDMLNVFIMIAFAQCSVLRRTLLIHASVVENAGRGYAFLGKSGTGKSTHSSLWMQHIEGTRLLNDDNPAVRVEADGSIGIYGTPWSGKTPCYRNYGVPLAAFVRLEQALYNNFSTCTDSKALIMLLPSCSSMRWNSRLYTALCDTLELIITQVPVSLLLCLPDEEAARLCYNKTNNQNKDI